MHVYLRNPVTLTSNAAANACTCCPVQRFIQRCTKYLLPTLNTSHKAALNASHNTATYRCTQHCTLHYTQHCTQTLTPALCAEPHAKLDTGPHAAPDAALENYKQLNLNRVFLHNIYNIFCICAVLTLSVFYCN